MINSVQYDRCDEVTVSTGQRFLASGTFVGCANLKRLYIQGNVEYISKYAIIDCPNLEEIYFSSKVSCIMPEFIKGYHKLSKLVVEQGNPVYSDFDSNIVVDVKHKLLILGCCSSNIPDDCDIVCVEANAFRGNILLDKVIIPKRAKQLGEYSFANCPALTEVFIRDNIVKLESGVFQNCKNLKSVVFGSNLNVLKNTGEQGGQFDNCPNLKTVKFEDKIFMNTVYGNTNESDVEDSYKWTKVNVSDPCKNATNFLSIWSNLEFRSLPKACLKFNSIEEGSAFIKGDGAIDIHYTVHNTDNNLYVSCHVVSDDRHDDDIIPIYFKS